MMTFRRAARLLTCGGACLLVLATVGCSEYGWVSRESAQGQTLEKLHNDKATIPVRAPAGWPYQFDPVEIQKKYSSESGTQYRPLIRWRQTGSPSAVRQQFAGLAKDTSGRHIIRLEFRLTYLDQVGRTVGTELIDIDPERSKDSIILSDFGKKGAPQAVTVALVKVIWEGVPSELIENPAED